MAPKKAVKPKKEEVVEIPRTDQLPNGPCTFFIGGWSAAQSLKELEAVTKAKDAGDRIVVLPGTLSHSEAVAAEVRSLTIVGAKPEAPAAAPAAAAAGEDGEEEAGNEAGATGEEQGSAGASEPTVSDFVTLAGAFSFSAWVPPVEAKAPTPPPVEETTKKDAKGAKAGGKDGKKKTVVIEEEAPPPPPPEPEVPAVGANPSAWPTLTFKDVAFTGTLTLRGVHFVFSNCHFIGGDDHQIRVHQYCKASFARCTFSGHSRAAIYAYPASIVDATDCTFTGVDLAAEQAAAAGDEAAAGRAAESLKRAESSTQSLGVHADDATVALTKCRFRKLSVGVLLHDPCKGSAVKQCTFTDVFNTGCYFDGCACTFQGNTISRCAYYGLQFKGSCGATKVLQNRVESKVRISAGARAPLLHSNTCTLPVEDHNDTGNIYMQPRY